MAPERSGAISVREAGILSNSESDSASSNGKMFGRWLSNQFSSNQAAPLLLLLVTFASFGVLIPWLGFYWDDWPVIYLRHTLGIQGFWDFYQYDRPFSAWTYIVLSPFLGTSPISWQIFSLLLRWLSAVFLWAGLKLLWPKKSSQALWIAILFTVFPIFTQQPVSVAYSQHWISYLFYFASVYFMLLAQANRRQYYLFTSLAAILSVIEMITMEYFLGLEIFRLAILWIYYRDRLPALTVRDTFKRVFAAGWIYIVLLGLFVVWRLFFIRLAGDDPNDLEFLTLLRQSPIRAFIDLAQKILQDFIYLLTAWLTAIKPEQFELNRLFFLLSLAVAVLAAVLLGIMLSRFQTAQERERDEQNGWHIQAISLGVVAILLGILPVWLIGRQISLGPLGNRFSLAAMFGLGLIIVGILEWLTPRSKAKISVICILVGVATFTNLNTSKAYQGSWEKQRTFYWQLYWRAPYIRPDTAFIAEGEIFPYVGLYSTSMGISLLYPPVDPPQKLPYSFFSYWERLYRFPEQLVAGTTLNGGIRNLTFSGSSQDALVLDFSPENNRCLHFVSPRDSDDKDLPDSLAGLLSISNLSRIQRESPGDWKPPESIFGPEPGHHWCYYFEKAELAYQYGDWSEVIRLMEEAKIRGLAPTEMQEYLPLLDAYLQTGNIQPALQLSKQIKLLSDKIDDRVCNTWLNAANLNSSTELDSAFDTVREQYSCFD